MKTIRVIVYSVLVVATLSTFMTVGYSMGYSDGMYYVFSLLRGE